ncbi:Dolichyl-phosphate-mannose-protein mannosyltransferase [anaerobic digester metagenome]
MTPTYRYVVAGLLVLLFAARFYGIDSPILDKHSWRQSDTAGTARNFHETGNSILLPQVDWRGDTQGYAEMEFPIYQYSVAKLYDVFGPREYVARIFSIALFALSALLLYRLVAETCSRELGLFTTLIYASLTTTTYYARTILPEPLLLASSAGALYFLWRYARTGGVADYILSLACLCLACLIKVSPLYLGLPLLLLFHKRHGMQMLRVWQCWLYAACVLVALYLWYSHAATLREATNLSFGLYGEANGKYFNWSTLATPGFWNRVLFERLAAWHFTWVLAPFIVWGICMRRQSPMERLFDLWGIAVFVYLILIPVGNAVHDYYQLPMLAPLCVFAAKPFARHLTRPDAPRLAKGVLILCLAVHVGIAQYNYVRTMTKHTDYAPFQRLHERLDALGGKDHPAGQNGQNSLVYTPTQGTPSLLYYLHRKGWIGLPTYDEFLSSHAVAVVGVFGWRNYIQGPTPDQVRALYPPEAFALLDDEVFIVVRK